MYLGIWFTDFIKSPTDQLQLLQTNCTAQWGVGRGGHGGSNDDEDDIAARFEKAMAHALNNMKPVAYRQNLDENKKYDADWALKRWKQNFARFFH